MASSYHRFGSNTGLLDARGTAQILHGLSARFSAVEFADFATICEEIVLRGKILMVGKREKLPRHLRAVLQPLYDAGVFFSLDEAFPIPDLPSDPRQLRAVALAIERGLTTASVEDATYEARRLLGGEAQYGVTATPLLRQLQHFGLVRRPSIENAVWDLSAQYHRLADVAQDVRRYLQNMAELPQVTLPPIALRAIQRSKTYEQVVHHVLELRDEFKPLREHLSGIEDRMREGRLSPAEALELESSWRQRWHRVAEKLDASTSRLALARTSMPILKDGIRLVKGAVNQDAIDIAATVVAWIGPSFEALGTLQVRPVHRSVSNYLATTDRDLVRAVARIFDTDFVRLDNDMRALARQAGNPWRLALDAAAASYRQPVAQPADPRPTPRSVIYPRATRDTRDVSPVGHHHHDAGGRSTPGRRK